MTFRNIANLYSIIDWLGSQSYFNDEETVIQWHTNKKPYAPFLNQLSFDRCWAQSYFEALIL